MKYFSGTIQIFSLKALDNAEFSALFPDIRGLRADGYSRWAGYDKDKKLLPVTRMIEYKANPSLHKCDARCRNAKGRKCECACGGQFHGN